MAKLRIIVLSLVATFMLVGCAGGSFGGFEIVQEDITETAVMREVRFADQQERGDSYVISVTVPEEWVGSFNTVSNGSVVEFNFVNERGQNATIFSIHTLSLGQFWEQNGSYPNSYRNLGNEFDTYFVYSAPLDAFWSGLSAEEFAAYSAQIEGIIASFESMPADDNPALATN